MFFWWIISISLTFNLNLSNANKYNVSYADLQRCKEYDARSGYGYHDYFSIDVLKTKNGGPAYDVINLHLFVLAAKDAHILLSPTNQVVKSSPVYEIVLGAGGNTFVEIRRQRQSQPLQTLRIKNLLSPVDPTPLTITVTPDGFIDVKITGQSTSIINATDKDPLRVGYISFSSWGTTEGKWFYNCDNDVDDDRLEFIKRNQSNYERLRSDLFTGYDTAVMPLGLSSVQLHFELIKCDFNSKKSFLITRGRFRAAWFDSKLVWITSDYGGIKSVALLSANESRQIWTPQIRLLNGKDEYFISMDVSFSHIIQSNGNIWAESREISFSTWCMGTQSKWPFNELECDILFGLDDFTNLTLTPHNQSIIDFKKPKFYNFDEGEWNVIRTNLSVMVSLSKASKESTYIDIVPLKHPPLNFSVTLERNNLFYSRLLTTPLIAAFCLILLSLWTDRYLRIMLNLVSLLIIFGMHFVFVDHAPTDFIPTIVVYYTSTLFIVWISLVVFIINCWRKERQTRHIMLPNIIKLTWLRLLLGMNESNSFDYKELQDIPMDDFRNLLDRIVFLILTFIFIICLACGI